MKRFSKKIYGMVTAVILSVFTFVAVADDFNYVQWYEYMGIYSVMSEIKDGSRTPFEACDVFIIPAYQAGKVTEQDKKYSLNIIPKSKLI